MDTLIISHFFFFGDREVDHLCTSAEICVII